MPRGIRFAAMLGLVLAALSGWKALAEATELAHFYETREQSLDKGLPVPVGDPVLHQRLVETYYAALEPMREPRAVLMGGLAVACAFVFVAAGRMLRPDGLPRDGMRRLLGRACLAVAVLRTIDGAQFAVVSRRMGMAMADALSKLPEYQDAAAAEMVRSVVPSFFLGLTVLGTALMAGTFALLGQYFRSEAVREAITAQDGPQEEGE